MVSVESARRVSAREGSSGPSVRTSMGMLSALLKTAAIASVLVLSAFLVELLLGVAVAVAAMVSPSARSGGYVSPLDGLVALATIAPVCVFFTVPAVLALFGHGVAWMRHVATRLARPLGVAFGISFGLYFCGATVLNLHGGDSVLSVLSILLLAGIGLGIVGLVSMDALLIILSNATAFFVESGRAVAERATGRSDPAVVELTVLPIRQLREKGRQESVRNEGIRFQRFAQTISATGRRVEFRICFREGRARVFVSMLGRPAGKEALELIRATTNAYLPEYRVRQAGALAEERAGDSCVLAIRGMPEALENPLEPLARYYLEGRYDGDYRVVLRRSWEDPFSKMLVRRRQRSLAKESQRGIAEQKALSLSQESSEVKDHFKELEMEEAARDVERGDSPCSIRAWVYLSAVARTPEEAMRIARGGCSVLAGAASGLRSQAAFKVREVRRLKGISAWGSSTLLLPAEAASLIWVPQTAMGTKMSLGSEFELPPELKGEIDLGDAVVWSDPTGHRVRVPLETLTKHLFVTGMTGSGKTTSCFNLLLQLDSLGIPFLVIEPVKTEYRSLVSAIPSLNVFTLGDEGCAPFRLNIFEPPEGVRIQIHIENLEAAWNSSFVMYAPLPYMIKEILYETYDSCGWSVRDERRGRPITLDDFARQAKKVARRSGYEPKVVMDIEAALETRISSLKLGGKGDVFDAVSSVPLKEVLARPTVFELKGIPGNEEKAFVMALVLNCLAEHLETMGGSRKLRHLTLIEEAHRLLPNISTEKGDPEGADPRRRTVEQFADMLAEVRAYGEGLALVDQIPTKIISDAIKNTATKIAHRLPALDDAQLMAGAMNVSQEQMGTFVALRPGEGIVSLEEHPLPIKILAPNLVERLGIPVGEVDDRRVREHMAEFYRRNPLPEAPDRMKDPVSIVDTENFRERFLRAYHDWAETGSAKAVTELAIQTAREVDRADILGAASQVLSSAARFYLPYDDEDRLTFQKLFARQVEQMVRNERKG